MKKINNFLILFTTFFSCSYASEKIDEILDCPFALYSTVTQDEVLTYFQKIRPLGSGGEARAFKVLNLNNEKHYALVIKNELISRAQPDHRSQFVEKMLENQSLNPHQSKIYGYFWIQNPNFPYCGASKVGVLPYRDVEEGDFFNRTYENDPEATPYRHEAILMELGIGDLSSQAFRSLNFNMETVDLFQALNSYSLEKAFINTSDNKFRNYIFIEVEGQKYLDQKMEEFDFWSYKMEDLQIYIPRPNFLIKRIDYSDWTFVDVNSWSYKRKLEFRKKWPVAHALKRLSRRLEITEEEFLSRFCQEPETGEILYIRNWE